MYLVGCVRTRKGWRKTFERFTDRARRVVVLGQEEARLKNRSEIWPEDVLIAVAHEGEGVGAVALREAGLNVDALRNAFDVVHPDRPEVGTSGHLPFTPEAKRAFEYGLREALQLGHSYIGSEHILLGLIRLNEQMLNDAFEYLNVDPVDIRTRVIEKLATYAGHRISEEKGEQVRNRIAADRRTPGQHKVSVRCEFFQSTDEPELMLESGEKILNVEHRGSQWWVYIARLE